MQALPHNQIPRAPGIAHRPSETHSCRRPDGPIDNPHRTNGCERKRRCPDNQDAQTIAGHATFPRQPAPV